MTTSNLQNPLALLGRILLAILFVMSGFNKIGGFEGTVGYIASKGLPLASLGAVIAIVCELGGGILVLLGLYTRVVGLVLAVFTLAAAVFFHNFWAVPAAETQNMFIHFWKNVSIAGGFLMLAAFGPGSISLDAKRGV
ncbi:MAG: DoxX family protein [Pseudomonadota bacterium]|nr:DoxX family protein [Pseudomonadota bacterium]